MPITDYAWHPATAAEAAFLNRVAGDLDVKVGQMLAWVPVTTNARCELLPLLMEQNGEEGGFMVWLGFFEEFWTSSLDGRGMSEELASALVIRLLRHPMLTPSVLTELGMEWYTSSSCGGVPPTDEADPETVVLGPDVDLKQLVAQIQSRAKPTHAALMKEVVDRMAQPDADSPNTGLAGLYPDVRAPLRAWWNGLSQHQRDVEIYRAMGL